MAETLLDRKLGTGSLVVKLDGQPIALDELGAVSIRHGRSKPDGQPEASSVSLVTKAARVPEVGQTLTVELGPDAREAFGLPRWDVLNLWPDPDMDTLSSGPTDWYFWNGDGAGSRSVQSPSAGWLHGITTAGRATWTTAAPLGHGGGLAAYSLPVEPGPIKLRTQARVNNHGNRLLLWIDQCDDSFSYGPGQWVSALVVAGQVVEMTLDAVIDPGMTMADVYVMANYPASFGGAGAQAFAPGDYLEATGILVAQGIPAGEPVPAWTPANVYAPQGPRFTGTVSVAQVTPEPGTKSSRRRVQVTAVSGLARLGRQLVGDTPWPAEQDGARVGRVLGLATGVSLGPVDSGTVQVLARDVDRQPILKLAQDVANDADGILGQLRDGRVVYHDADHRQLVAVSVELDATEVLWPVVWTQDLDGMVNDLTVTYGAAEPQAEYREVDDAAVAAFGLYAAKVSTKLADLAAAEAYALLTTARRGRPWWDLSTVSVDLVRALDGGLHPQAGALLLLELSDLVRIVGWPTSGPQQLGRLWVEGWTETITSSSWRMVLAVSPFGRSGPAARWVDVASTLTWATFPALTWAQLASWDPGTGPSSVWYGAPSDLTWAAAPATTWAAWPY